VDWEGQTGTSRSYATDTDHEHKPVQRRDHESWFAPQKACADSTGFVNQATGLMTDMVMQKAIGDKLAQASAAEPAEVVEVPAEEELQKGGNDDDEFERLRAARRQEMLGRHKKQKEYLEAGHGEYTEIVEEEFLKNVTSSKRAVCHFYHRSFERCKIIDMHLSRLAKKFIGTKFVKLDAEKSPFFTAKIQIRTLPTVGFFIDGVLKHKQVGMQGLPGGDEFRSVDFARLLREHDVVEENFDSEDEEWL